jgi:hypothetical protein
MTDAGPAAAPAAPAVVEGGPATPAAPAVVEGAPATPDAPDAPDAPAAQAAPGFATFRVMDVEDVALDLPSQYPAVTLVESEPPMRMLVFPVGLPEGTAIAQALRRMDGRRPMTHELFMRVLQQARIDVIAVRLVGREEGTLLAELDLMLPEGRARVDCRPSDAIVLALRMPVPAPILADERLLDDPGEVPPLVAP